MESQNLHRRHLSAEVRKRLADERAERVRAKKAAGKSTRTIAEEEGVSEPQIRRDLKRAGASPVAPALTPEAAGEVEEVLSYSVVDPPPAEPEKVTGKDGKKHPATKPVVTNESAPPPRGGVGWCPADIAAPAHRGHTHPRTPDSHPEPGAGMLTLTRTSAACRPTDPLTSDLVIYLPDGRTVTVSVRNTDGREVKVGIAAPRDIKVLRAEVANRPASPTPGEESALVPAGKPGSSQP